MEAPASALDSKWCSSSDMAEHKVQREIERERERKLEYERKTRSREERKRGYLRFYDTGKKMVAISVSPRSAKVNGGDFSFFRVRNIFCYL